MTPWTLAGQAPLSSTVSWSLLRFMSIESVMLSNHLILYCPLLLLLSIFPSIRVFSSESALPIRWPKCWSFSFSISPSNEYSGLISWLTGLISLQFKGLSRVFCRTTAQNHQFFSSQPSFLVQLSHPYITTEKNHSFVYMDLLVIGPSLTDSSEALGKSLSSFGSNYSSINLIT